MLLINNEPNKILICGSPTSTEALGHNKEIEARPKGIAQEEEVQIKELQDLRSGIAQGGEAQTKKPQDLRGGGQEKKEPHIIQAQQQVETIPTIEEEVSKIQFLEVEPQTKLMEKEVKDVELEMGIKPLVA